MHTVRAKSLVLIEHQKLLPNNAVLRAYTRLCQKIVSIWQLAAPTNTKRTASAHPRAPTVRSFFWIRHSFFGISLHIQKKLCRFALLGSKFPRPAPLRSPIKAPKNQVLVWNPLINSSRAILNDKCSELVLGSLRSVTWTRLLQPIPTYACRNNNRLNLLDSSAIISLDVSQYKLICHLCRFLYLTSPLQYVMRRNACSP